MATTITVLQHAVGHEIAGRVTSGGAGVDLTGASVRFVATSVDGKGRTRDIDGACTIVDAAEGRVSYALDADDVASAGDFRASFQIVGVQGVTRAPSFEYMLLRVLRDL